MSFSILNHTKQSQDEQTDIITDILTSGPKKEGICVSLTGNLGIGKTYRWNNVIAQELKAKKFKTVYISCFGKSQLCDIKLELLYQIIKIQHPGIQFIICFILAIILCILTCGIIFNMNGLTFSFGAGLIIFALYCLLVGSLYDTLVKYLANKFIGVDNNNIEFSNFYKNNIVLCFDDIERIRSKQTSDNIFGFIEELKNIGYPILLILNPNQIPKNEDRQNIWNIFKEKVITDDCIQTDNPSILNSILSEYSLNEQEIKYLHNIYNNLSLFDNDIQNYSEEEKSLIQEKIKINYRLIKIIIKNILFVRKYLKEYNSLQQNTIESILSFIGFYTVYSYFEELQTSLKKNDTPDNENSNEKNKYFIEINEIKTLYDAYYTQPINFKLGNKKHIGNIFIIQQPLKYEQLLQIKQLLDSKQLNGSITINEYITDTEKFAMFRPIECRTNEIKSKIQQIYESMIKEENPFTSMSSMGGVLGLYCSCKYELLNDKFSEKDFVNILKVMEKFIKQNQSNLKLNEFIHPYNNLIFITDTTKRDKKHQEYPKAVEYLNKEFKRLGLKNAIELAKADKNFFDTYQDIYTDSTGLVYLFVLATDTKYQKDLSNMKKNEYSKFINIMRYLAYGVTITYHDSTIKLLDNSNTFLNKLKRFLIKEINSISKLPDAGISENNAKSELLDLINDSTKYEI